MDWLIDTACRFNDTAASALGWTASGYALVSAAVTGALAWGFLATWLFAFGKLRRHGLAKRQQQLVWWFAFAVALVQIALTLIEAEGIALIPCPWSGLVLSGVAFIFILMAYGFHIQDENKASASTFFSMVALPLLGEVAITAKATVSIVMSALAWLLRIL